MGFQGEIKEALPPMLKKRALDRAALILETRAEWYQVSRLAS